MRWETEDNLLSLLHFCDKLLLNSSICSLAVNKIKVILHSTGKNKITSRCIKIRDVLVEGYFGSWLFFSSWVSSENDSNSVLYRMTYSLALSSTTVNTALLEEEIGIQIILCDVKQVGNGLSLSWRSLGLRRLLAYGSSVMMKQMWF